MLIRLGEVSESMRLNKTTLDHIKQSNINVESHEDLEECLADLASASNRCKDANRVILDMTFRYCQLFILAGCYGRVVRTEPLFTEKESCLSTLKHSLETNERLIDKRLSQCN